MSDLKFTDDNLKHLKDKISIDFGHPQNKTSIGKSEIDGLIYRLEAAEQVCFGTMIAHPENETCECSLCDLLREWRKAAGKL